MSFSSAHANGVLPPAPACFENMIDVVRTALTDAVAAGSDQQLGIEQVTDRSTTDSAEFVVDVIEVDSAYYSQRIGTYTAVLDSKNQCRLLSLQFEAKK
jgi:hypothetical protein